MNSRNELCKCGSGLKTKKCHGDTIFQNNSMEFAKHLMTFNITLRMYDKGLMDGDIAKESISKLMVLLNRQLPSCLELKSTFKVKDDSKDAEAASINDIRKGMVACEKCGRRLPAGMKCSKCN